MKTSGEAGEILILIEESWGKCRKRRKGALPETVHHAPKTCIDELGEWTLVLNVAWACTCNCKQSDWKQQFASIQNFGRRMDLQDQTNWVKLEIEFLPVTRLEMLSCQRGPSKMNECVLKDAQDRMSHYVPFSTCSRDVWLYPWTAWCLCHWRHAGVSLWCAAHRR